MQKITAKQDIFCREYLVDLNGTQAAIRAGYSKKGANSVEDLYYEIGKNTISPVSACNALIGDEEYTEEDLIQKINDTVYVDQKSESNVIVVVKTWPK